MTPILVRPAAAADIEEAVAWYGRLDASLADRFLAAVEGTVAKIAANPTMYSVIHRDIRRALVERFPYGIYYRIYPDVVVILACMHARRDPKRWRGRK